VVDSSAPTIAATTRIAYRAIKMAPREIRIPKPLSNKDSLERKNIIKAAGRLITMADNIESKIA
jgi:hypothetical protein